MTRKSASACLLALFFGFLSPGQTSQNQSSANKPQPGAAANQSPAVVQQNGQASSPSDDDLPEEDESVKPRVYPFNPLEAERNVKVGNFYMHQGTARGYRAAVGRFEDATKYNPSSAEAFFRLGEAEEKLKHSDKAKAAFQRAVQLAPDSKFGHDARKKLATLG